MKQYFVYILASETGTLYVGITCDIERRVSQHRTGFGSRFADRYKVHKLVHCEMYTEVQFALAREKQIKGWTRAKKIALIEEQNPGWVDLAATQPGGDFLKQC